MAERLLGPLLYRATSDLAAAEAFLRDDPTGPALGPDLPLIAMGFSAGGLAAMGHAHGLDGLPPPRKQPAMVVGVSCIPPQPWRLCPDGPPTVMMTARGDAVFPRQAVGQAMDIAPWIEAWTLPYGAHNRPIRDLIGGRDTDDRPWQDAMSARMLAAVAGP